MNDAEKRLVFVVEDDQEVRISTRTLLEASGYSVREFASGEDVIAAGDAAAAGCIVLDQDLSGISGLELIRQLRADGVQTPAIMVSGNGRKLVAAATNAGIDAVLHKPISAAALEQWLEQIFSSKPHAASDSPGRAPSV
ncbi:MAG TPA: response regulator [Rhizomicrobium sp.]|nr:response regulator [Rhizomicrobium sp.]